MRLKLLALDGNIRRAELEIGWADEALGWLDALERDKGVTKTAKSAS